ncbi:hypothetical protein ACHAXN_005212 [Cyclotella atomus]
MKLCSSDAALHQALTVKLHTSLHQLFQRMADHAIEAEPKRRRASARSLNMHRTVTSIFILALLSATLTHPVSAWSNFLANSPTKPSSLQVPSCPVRINTCMYGGVGAATSYTWKEEQFEIELTLTVPPTTTAKDIKFKCSSTGIDLRLLGDSETILLDGNRKTRGKICVDGTFWSISDGPRNKSGEKQREINVMIEKHFVPTSTSGGVSTYDTTTDFDWGGIYPDDEAEVTSREYEVAHELNVREYAAKLGVDIDNIDMSKVDKTMFGAELRETDAVGVEGKKKPGTNLNITQATLDQLVKFGLAKEVVRQGDGTEYEMDAYSSDLERKHFSVLGKDVSVDELRVAGVVGTPIDEQSVSLNAGVDEQNAAASYSAVKKEAELIRDDDSVDGQESSASEDDDLVDPNAKDPIDKLTVQKLREVLRNAGLKVSGNKSELKQRLRDHVQSLLEESET